MTLIAAPPAPPPPGLRARYDVVVVGAGIVGLAHAHEALLAGASVAVLDRASSVAGASVRNFGHVCLTPQTGPAREHAERARGRWLELSAAAGFTAAEVGTTVVARRPEELAVLEEFATSADAVLLDRRRVLARVPVDPDGVLGGAHLPRDLQVDPRTAVPAIAAHLRERGADLAWRTAVLGVESGRVITSRGEIGAGTVVVATGHDVDELFPDLAEATGVVRCRLHMLRVRADLRFPLTTPLLTGWSLLRYSGFAATSAAGALREALAAELPAGIAQDLNLMVTAQPDGSLIIGDTHARGVDAPAFQSEEGFALVLEQVRRLFGVRSLEVLERWQGVYASAPGREFLVEQPVAGVHVVAVTTGIGMTTALGLASAVLSGPTAPSSAPASSRGARR